MGFRLTVEQGRGQGQTFDLEGPEVGLGRAEGNDVVVLENGVSRRHASISFEEGRWVLRDLGTANGTFLNGSRVEAEYLETGDTIGIGQTLLRFEETGGGETRIVSLSDPALAGDEAGTNPGVANPVAADGRLSPRAKKLLGIGGGALLFLIIIGRLLGGGEGSGIVRCPSELLLRDGIRDFTFGTGVDADCQAGDELTFVFVHVGRTRVILQYFPFFTERGELGIYVNGVKVSDVPMSQSQQGVRHEYAIPDRALTEGEQNTLQFRYEGEGDGAWGVRRIELEVIALNEADAEKAQAAYDLAQRSYRERNVAAPNLYLAWEQFREARRYMEGLDPKPPTYEPTLTLIRDIEKELDKLCKERLFAANRAAKYGRYDAANDHYKFLLAAFPGDRHACRAEAQASMWIEEGPSGE